MNSGEQKQRQKEQRDKLIELAKEWNTATIDMMDMLEGRTYEPDAVIEAREKAAEKAFRDYVEHMHDEAERFIMTEAQKKVRDEILRRYQE